MSAKKETDWKAIALALGQRVNFAVQNCEARGSGMMFNTNTGETSDWRDYMAEALEMIPGVKVDREILATMHLPPAKRRKAQKEIADRRAIAKATTGEQP